MPAKKKRTKPNPPKMKVILELPREDERLKTRTLTARGDDPPYESSRPSRKPFKTTIKNLRKVICPQCLRVVLVQDEPGNPFEEIPKHKCPFCGFEFPDPG